MLALLWSGLVFAEDPRDLVAPLGTEDLSKVGELAFTFNVERDGAVVASRSWTWRPADGAVTMKKGEETVTFRFGAPTDEAQKKADSAFVNDSFWLAPQMHLRWAASDLTVTDGGTVPKPIGEGTARKVVMQYAPTGGGYTPGDGYDLYLDETGRIVAWSYRKGGQPEPDLTTTFEAYVTTGPLTISTDRRSADGKFRVFFTDVSVKPPG